MQRQLTIADIKIEIPDTRIEMHEGVLTAEGPVSEVQYTAFTPDFHNKHIPRDQFYVAEDHPEYDLALLRERLVAEVVMPQPARPEAGHAVRLEAPWSCLPPGKTGIIEGVVGQPQDGVSITFNYSAFRGPASRYSADLTPNVSCSGGPGTIYTPAEELFATGEYMEIGFWRWRDSPKADGGEAYHLLVPIWGWRPAGT